MSDEDLDFSGGATGMAADHADMRATAQVLDDKGTDLSGIAGRARGMTYDGDLLMSVPFSPGSAARAEGLLLSAATQLTLRNVRLEALALLLRTKAGLIEVADGARDLGGHVVEDVTGYTVGVLAVPLTVAAVAGGVAWFLGGTAGEGGEALLDVLSGDVPLSELDDRLKDAPAEQLGDMREAAILFLRDHPGVTDAVTGGLPGFVNGAVGPLAPVVPDDYEGVLSLLLGGSSPFGVFDDRKVDVTDRTPADSDITSLAGLWDSANALQSTVADDHDASAVRITRVGGRWVVQIPGTQEWNPSGGGDPSDLTSNIELMDDGQAEIMAAVVAAMREAGIGPGDEVMMMGHSQGGIAAMAMAADGGVQSEFNITTVFTGGSPIGRIELPDGVSVVSLEHEQDPVPRLDSEGNPDLPDWTTVSRDLSGVLEQQDQVGREEAARQGTRYFPNPIAPHSGELYQQTAALLDAAAERARNGSTSPDDVEALRVQQVLAGFLGDGTSTDYRLERRGR